MFAFLYPLIPWPGVMMLGYLIGAMYKQDYISEKRQKQLQLYGIVITLFFIALRLTNFYGDPSEGHMQKNIAFTVLSFLNEPNIRLH